jgi:N utilization substance protein B
VSARGKARKRALDVLYASEMRSESPVTALERAIEAGEGPTNPYTAELVRAVVGHQTEIDRILRMYSESWTLERMPAVDRNVLRLGVYEVIWADDVPDAVAVSEALALVRDLSTDDSPTYVNGVLGAVVRDKSHLLEDLGLSPAESAGEPDVVADGAAPEQ